MNKPDECKCTMCGKPLDEFDVQNRFGLDHRIGYGSRYDGDHLKARFCSRCFDSIIDYIAPLCLMSPFVGPDEEQ